MTNMNLYISTLKEKLVNGGIVTDVGAATNKNLLST
jgi:hypothetical protein